MLQDHPLYAIMHPRSVAMVGASNDFSKMGTIQLMNLMGGNYPGKIYPIHPKEETVFGLKAYRSGRELPEPVDLATIDVSFISLSLILPAVTGWLKPAGQIVMLIKPQFEAGREQVGKGGVVRDPAIHADVLRRVLSWANAHGLTPAGAIRSPITGPAGNVEFLAHLERGQAPCEASEIQAMVESCGPLVGGNGASV